MFSLPIDLLDRALSIKATRRSGFRPAPARLQGIMPAPDVWEESSLNVPPVVWRREDMRLAGRGPAGVLVERGLHISSLPHVNADRDEHARWLRLSDARLRTVRQAHWRLGLRATVQRRLSAKMRVEKLDGDAILLGAYYPDCKNYFHFWVDTMCDLWFLKQCGLDLSSVRHVLMPWSGVGWQREIVAMCGIPEARIVPLSSADGFVLETAHLPVRIKGGSRNPDWIVSALREVSGWRPPERVGPARRLYVTRGGAMRRPFANETEVLDVLTPLGFDVIDCATLSVADQRHLFATAEIVVAPHGAGLTNIAWARAGTKLIEFMPRAHANPCFLDLASQAGVVYRNVPSAVQDERADPLFAPFSVDPGHVAIVLREMLAGPQRPPTCR
ncbi:Protein of unknown function [Stappia sp. ES.058]|nr:Protein of unknown function [Stappia sp. ES.058]